MVQQANASRSTLAQDAQTLNLIQFWEQRTDIELLRPRNAVKAYRWRWEELAMAPVTVLREVLCHEVAPLAVR